jgi:putative hydrolase of the HAD superfamily
VRTALPRAGREAPGYDDRMTQVQAVLLDLDATLLDYDEEAWAQTVREVCAGLARSAPGLRANLVAQAYMTGSLAHWRATEGTVPLTTSAALDASATWREIWGQALAACGHPDGGLPDRAVELYRQGRLRRYRLFDEVTEVLTALRQRVGALGLITNGAGDTQRDKLAVTGLGRYLDAIVISGEAGVAKPDPAIFDLALSELAVPPEAAWHVGDSLAADIAGARNAHLGTAIWLNRSGLPPPAGAPAPTHEIRSLRALVPLLQQSQPQPSPG